MTKKLIFHVQNSVNIKIILLIDKNEKKKKMYSFKFSNIKTFYYTVINSLSISRQ